MANTILITANWHTGALSQQTISRQYDNNRYVVQFVGYPEASEGNELDYYLLVWMSSAPGETPDEIAPIQLASDQWYISNVFTQQTQQIKFQMCALNTEGTFEAHSPIFTGFVRNSLEHDGTTQDIDVSTLFDAYREYLNELIIRAGAVVIDSTPTQGSSNAVSSGGVYEALHNTDTTLTQSGQAADAKVVGDALAGKVAKPLTSPNGTSGQLLRTLGNGQTEWTDFATPTSEQVGEAVDEWLDEHPEATTTVQDWSLTANKLVKGTLGFVMPEMFGAVGDGITDDTQAIKNCIDYAIENNLATHLLPKTYIISPSVLSFNIADGQSIVVDGQGQNTIIKLKDAGLDGKWSQLFTIVISPVSSKAHDVIFSNFCIDGNRRNQGEIASDSYEYEGSQMISIRGATTGTLENGLYLDRFIVDNMRFYDPVADCVNISGSAQIGIRDVFLHRIVSTDRSGTRNDIGITGNPLHLVHISDCDCDTIHFEYNSVPTDDLTIPYIISNCRFGICSLGAKIDLLLTDCVITNAFLLGSFRRAKVSGCDIKISTSAYTVLSANGVCDFDNCLFRTPSRLKTDETAEASSMYIRQIIRCTIRDCEFLYTGEVLNLDYDADEVNDHIQGAGLAVEQSMQNPVIVDKCMFDERYQYCFNHRNNNIVFKNAEVETAYVCSHSTANSAYHDGKMEFDNIKLSDKSIGVLGWGNIAIPEAVTGKIIVLPKNFKNTTLASSYLNNWFTNVTGNFRREVYIDEPLTFSLIKEIASYVGYQSRNYFHLIKGDTFVYNGENSEHLPNKWIILNDGETVYSSANVLVSGVALENRIITVGNGSGATADRPTCYLSKGFQYFDTDIGKMIFWNGTGWVDSTGTIA